MFNYSLFYINWIFSCIVDYLNYLNNRIPQSQFVWIINQSPTDGINKFIFIISLNSFPLSSLLLVHIYFYKIIIKLWKRNVPNIKFSFCQQNIVNSESEM